MAEQYDVIVVGLGAMGAAALYQASKRGAKALGIDRFHPPHTLGSSHGDTRITREAIGEGEFYVPLVRRSDQIWRELESLSGRRLFEQSGGLIIAPPSASATFHGEGDFVEASARVAKRHGIAHEVIDAEEIRRRHPLLKPRSIDRAYYEPGAGVLRPERCIQTQLDLARQAGAAIQMGEKVLSYEATDNGVTLTSERGRYSRRQADPGGGRLDGRSAAGGLPRWVARLPASDLLVRGRRHQPIRSASLSLGHLDRRDAGGILEHLSSAARWRGGRQTCDRAVP